MTSARVNSGSSHRSQVLPPALSHRSSERQGHRLVSSSSDSKLSTGRYNRRGCLLDDPNMGVISMNDHNVQACLCRYCTCGKHKCPGEPYSNPYPKSMFTSQYQGEFLPGSLSKPMLPPKPLPKANLNQMDLLTIYERDYRPFRLEGEDQFLSPSRGASQPAGSQPGFGGDQHVRGSNETGQRAGFRGTGDTEGDNPFRSSYEMPVIDEQAGDTGFRSSGQIYRGRVPKQAPFPKFSGVSSYHVEFPSWGGSNPYYMKRMYDGVPTREMPFEAKTLYCDSYRPTGPRDTFTSKVAEMSKQGCLGLPTNVKMFMQTSTGSAYKPIAKEFLGTRFPRKYERVLTADLAFATTEYKDNYVKQPPLMTNPHAVRRELDARESQ